MVWLDLNRCHNRTTGISSPPLVYWAKEAYTYISLLYTMSNIISVKSFAVLAHQRWFPQSWKLFSDLDLRVPVREVVQQHYTAHFTSISQATWSHPCKSGGVPAPVLTSLKDKQIKCLRTSVSYKTASDSWASCEARETPFEGWREKLVKQNNVGKLGSPNNSGEILRGKGVGSRRSRTAFCIGPEIWHI